MKKYLTEFVGTFLFLFTIGMVISPGAPDNTIAPLAIGAMLMVMVYMGGHVSGGAYNPAVTLALALRGALKWADFIPYVLAQLLGGFAGAYLAYALGGNTNAPAPATDNVTLAYIGEFIFTFALCLVVLNVATSRKTEGKGFYGLAIGFTVVCGAFAVGPISGGAFNPAVTAGLQIVQAMDGSAATPGIGHLVPYVLAQLVGGAIAAAMFKVQEKEDPTPAA